jgi:LPS-assembly lipoprotein
MLRILSVLVVGLALAGCSNYRPLYGSNGVGGGAAQSLTGIAIAEQDTRSGQLLRNKLLTAIVPAGAASTQTHDLKLVVTEKSALTAKNALTKVTRKRFRLSVDYQLFIVGGASFIHQGKSFAEVSYDTVGEPIADIQAEKNAQDRAAGELAQDIKIRLAAYFAALQH